MKTLIALAMLTAIASPAAAQDAHAKEAIALAERLNDQCRGSPGNAPNLEEICDRRDEAFKLAARLGWCNGKRNQATYQYRWHKCTRGSIRP